MATFSSSYSRAYHVLPLPAWKGIAAAGALKAEAAEAFQRPTTARVDAELGFGGFIHFYLPKHIHNITDLPILQAQLQPADRTPFPHAVIEVPTGELEVSECLVCNWNLAVSRPAVPGLVRGGNWTRGTDPKRIREVWEAFRASNPTAEAARGFFVEGLAVPVLRGEEITRNLKLLLKSPRGVPELLIEDSFDISRADRLIVFSEADRRAAEKYPVLPVELRVFPGYDDHSPPRELRARLEAFFHNGEVSEQWDFDAIRRAS